MKRYYISHTDDVTKKRNTELYSEVRSNGKCLGSEWNGDYYITTYKYNNKFYELWDNMEYGIMSEVVEYEQR